MSSTPPPNYVNPPTHGHAITVILALSLAAAVAIVAARSWARHVILRQVDFDDALILVSLAFALAAFVISRITYYRYGGNLHTWDYKDEYKVPWAKLIFVTIHCYLWGLFCSKLSLLLFFRRLLSRITFKRYRYVNDALIILLVTGTIGFFVAQLLTCIPIEAYWKMYDKTYQVKYTCTYNNRALSICNATFSIFTDFAIATFPLWFLHRLKIRKEKKWPIAMILSLGFITCCFSLARVFVINAVYEWVTDVVWFRAYTQFLQLMEQNLAVICAAAPSLRIYFTRRGTKSIFGYSSYKQFSQSYIRPSAASSSGRHNRKPKPGTVQLTDFGTIETGAQLDENTTATATEIGSGVPDGEAPPHAVLKRVEINVSSVAKQDDADGVELSGLAAR